MADDNLATKLAAIRDRTARVLAAASPSPDLVRANEAVHGVVADLLRRHGDEPVFLGADDCECPPRAVLADPDDWEASHPPGAGGVGRICLLSKIGRYCPACTELVYEDDGAVGDEYVAASACIVRPLIEQALASVPGSKEN